MKTLPLLACLLAILPAMTVLQGQDAPPVLSLKEAVDRALQMNPGIRKAEAAYELKTAEWRTLTGISSPEAVFAREGISAVAAEPFQEQRFSIQQNLDFPLTGYYRIKQSLAETEAERYRLDALRKEIRVGVKTRYTAVLYAQHIRDLRAEQYRLSKELDEAVQTRVESGVGSHIDLLSSNIRLVQAENLQYEAERLFHESRYRLFSFIGLDPNYQRYDIRFADTLYTHDELIEQEIALYSLDEQPQYRSAAASIRASEYGLKGAKSGFLPGMRFGYLVQDFGTGYHFSGFEGGLTIPLWGFLNETGEIRMAKARKAEFEWEQKAVELSIKEKIELAWHSYDNSQITMQFYREQLKGKSEELLSLTREAYRLGQIDLLKLLEAQQLYLSSQEKYLEAMNDYYLRLIELEQYVNLELVY